MCKDKKRDERFRKTLEQLHLDAIKSYAELGNVEMVLEETEALLFDRSYAGFVDRGRTKQIDNLFEMCYKLTHRITKIEKQLAEMK